MRDILVRSAGAKTTVQDQGRFGYQSLGVPPAGAMDRDALETANLLVGNSRGEACLECVLGGAELECAASLVFAVCGAPMDLRVNGKAAPYYETLFAEAGDVISLGMAERGLCAYVAFAGGLDLEPVLRSRSTYERAGFGGWHGRSLRAGDRIPVRESATSAKAVASTDPKAAATSAIPRPSDAAGTSVPAPTIRFVPEELRPPYPAETILRAIRSHEAERFEPEALGLFFSEPFTVTPKSDRMGCRLEGPRLAHSRGADILSSGVQTGTVQVPGDGFPIILRVDHQTTGGYARIAHVIQADLAKLGRLRPGDTLRFVETTVEAAQAAWKEREALITGLVRTKTSAPSGISGAVSGSASGLTSGPVSGPAFGPVSGAPEGFGEKRRFKVIVSGMAYDVTVEEL